MRYQVTALSRAIQDRLSTPGTLGTLHSVFDHALNIRLHSQNRIIAVTFAGAGKLPYALMLAETSERFFPAAGLDAGMEAILIEADIIEIGAAHVRIDFQQAEIWTPDLPPLADPEDIPAFLELIEWSAEFISTQARQAGLVPLLGILSSLDSGIPPERMPTDQTIAQLAIPVVVELIHALKKGDRQALASATGSLVGFGIGGTPSGDDLLVGMLAALQRVDNDRSRRLRSDLKSALDGCLKEDATSLLSLTVMQHALAGQFSEKVHEVTGQLIHPTDPHALHASLSRLLLHGATSGAEMLLGILLGYQLVYRI